MSKEIAKKMDAVVETGMASGWGQPQYEQALRGLIAKERQWLRQGKRALNKNKRAWAQ